MFFTSDPNPAQIFDLNTPVTGRYVTFATVSFPPGVHSGLGISEFQVNGVPEPSTLPVAAGLVLLVVIRKRIAN